MTLQPLSTLSGGFEVKPLMQSRQGRRRLRSVCPEQVKKCRRAREPLNPLGFLRLGECACLLRFFYAGFRQVSGWISEICGFRMNFGGFRQLPEGVLRRPMASGAISVVSGGISAVSGGFRRISADKGDAEIDFRCKQSTLLNYYRWF